MKRYRIKTEYDFYRTISTEKGFKPVLVIYHVQVKIQNYRLGDNQDFHG